VFLEPPLTLNGLPLRYFLQFYPSSFFLLTNVVILSLAFLGSLVAQLACHLSLLDDLFVIKLILKPLQSFWYWFKFKFFPPKAIPKSVKLKVTKAKQGQARKLLKLLMFAAAALPTVSTPDACYKSNAGHDNPAKVITSTANLSAFNLQELTKRLSTTNLFSVFKGLISSPVTPVLLDCGASACTSPHMESFEPGTLKPLKSPIMMEGVGGGVEITMQGLLAYHTLDDNGAPVTIKVPGYYAPHLKQSLFSPQIMFMTSSPHASVLLSGTTAVLQLMTTVSITLHLDLHSQLFYMPTFNNVQDAADKLVCNLQLTQDSNQNLSQGQQNHFCFHHALVHIGFSTIRMIGKMGWLGLKGQQLGDSSSAPPLCASCQYGKGHMRNTGSKTSTPTVPAEGAISKNVLHRGELVCMDHFTITEHGHLWHTKGQEHVDKWFHGGTIFVDVGSGKFVLKFQVSLCC